MITSSSSKKHPMFFWGWMTLIIATIVIVMSIFMIDPPANEQTADALPWNATLNDQGQFTVLGLTLGQSSSRDAMTLYGKETRIILFTDKENQPVSIETFFEDMYIGYSFRGRLILTLETSNEQRNQILNRGGRVKSTDSGAREITLSGEDLVTALDMPIRVLTYIPSPKLDEDTLRSRFGEPEQDSIGGDGLRRWSYPDKKLLIIFDESGRKILEFGE